MNQFEITVQPEQKSERIDKFLASTGENWSRTQVQQWVKEGLVSVNGKSVKANYKMQPGDQVNVTILNRKNWTCLQSRWIWTFTMRIRTSWL